jgi:hypothetical protein
MPDNKRQHYVPKSTLRHFACDADERQINIINIKRGRIISRASLRDQCYRDYFYGKATQVEQNLCQMEGIFAGLARKMIGSNKIDRLDGLHIVMMIALQRARTLRAEEEINGMVDKMAKLMMFNRVSEEELRKVRVGLTDSASFMVGQALALSPITLDLKQFLIVNQSSVPFIISDNPVVVTNWFCRVRLPSRSSAGMTRSGLQMFMPLSPKHALLLHDNNVYQTDCENNVIVIIREQDAAGFNELQWFNAHKNVYFPPSLGEEHVEGLLKTERSQEELFSFQRLESTEDANTFRSTDKDEFAPPSENVTSELLHFSAKPLPKDIRVRGVKIRARPRYHDDGSMGSPRRDPI